MKQIKVRIKQTGEIINIADYARVILDKCDSYGTPIELDFNEVEFIKENTNNDINWEQRRYELAKAAMQGLLNATSVERFTLRIKPSSIAEASLEYSDELIKKLKKNNKKK